MDEELVCKDCEEYYDGICGFDGDEVEELTLACDNFKPIEEETEE